MKKIIKILSLLIFIIFILGITTSNALTVTTNTSNEAMANALNTGESLEFKNYAYSIYRENEWIFCRQKGGHLYNYTVTYTLDKRLDEDGKIEYPSDDIEGNGYAIAYILGYGKAAGYEKSDIQKAYWKIIGYTENNELTDKAKELYNLADAYQKFKKTETTFKVNQTKAKTTTIGNELIYGPIQITYAYAGVNGQEIGGFDFSVDGIDATTGNVQLCEKSGTEYVSIDDNDDRQIRTAEYSGQDLYIKVNLNEVNDSKLNVNIEYNEPDVSVVIYQIKGTHSDTGTKTIFCIDCENKMASANEDYAAAVKDKNLVVRFNSQYWKYSGLHGMSFDDKITTGFREELRYYYLYRFGDVGKTTETSAAVKDHSYYCNECGLSGEKKGSYSEAQELLINHLMENHTSFTMGGNSITRYYSISSM